MSANAFVLDSIEIEDKEAWDITQVTSENVRRLSKK
jgi:hypothetical protein